MQKPTKNLYKANSLLIVAAIITIIIAYLSLIKLRKLPINFTNIDKVQHIIGYFFLTLTWMVATKKKQAFIKTKYVVLILCIFYGILIEVLQGNLTNYRELSILDILANSAGSFLALAIFNVFFKKKRLFNK